MTLRLPKDNWVPHGRRIDAIENLDAVRQCLERGPVIVEHWFYYGARSPARLVFEDFEAYMEYINSHAKPGDAIHVWDFSAACRDDNAIASGKRPDSDGCTPLGGAY